MKDSTKNISNVSDLSADRASMVVLTKERKSAAAPSEFNSDDPAGQEGAVWIAKSSRVEGRIEDCDTCVVAGIVEGFIATRLFEIQANGQVMGEVHADDAIIIGNFDGQLLVSGLLRLKSGAQVTGNIAYGQIEIESGAKLVGRIQATGVSYSPRMPFLRRLFGIKRK